MPVAYDKNIFYASVVDETTFQSQGAINSINTVAVDGAPAMDAAGTLYFVSTAEHNPPANYSTLYTGPCTGTTMTGSMPLTSLTLASSGWVHFDIGVHSDRAVVYFSDGVFTDNSGIPG